MLTVAIIGAGPLGRWLALSAARAGYRVLLEDVMPANLHHAQEYIRRQLGPGSTAVASTPLKVTPAGEISILTDEMNLRDMPAFHDETGFLEGSAEHPATIDPNATGDLPVAALSAEPENRAPIGSLVTFVSTIEDAVRDADLAIDCVPDELESKLEILWLLDRMSPPRTVLATPTIRLSITDLAACTYRADKCVAIVAEARGLAESPASRILLHTTPHTTPETVDLLQGFWRQLGFSPLFEQEPAAQPAAPSTDS